jgi:hypothetical protein
MIEFTAWQNTNITQVSVNIDCKIRTTDRVRNLILISLKNILINKSNHYTLALLRRSGYAKAQSAEANA